MVDPTDSLLGRGRRLEENEPAAFTFCADTVAVSQHSLCRRSLLAKFDRTANGEGARQVRYSKAL